MVIQFLLAILTFLPTSTPDNGDDCEWRSVFKDETMEVFTRCSEERQVKEIKVIQELEADLDVLIETLNDVDQYTSWVYKCAKAEVVEYKSDETFYYYTSTDMPFPTSDRDLVVFTTQWFDDEGVFYSNSVASPNKVEKDEDMVRVDYFESMWKIQETKPGKIKIVYTLSTDPGGLIPKWMINLGITIGPKKTMKSLASQVRKRMDDYSAASSY